MDNPKLSGGVDVHLREGVKLESARTKHGGFYTTVGGDLYDGFGVTLYGAVTEMRRLADELYRMAEEAERTGKRQRALDNAPASRRTKFVLEGEETTTLAA
jgi:hypothetical protein